MLGPISHLLGGRALVLASGSPRRRQILENIGFPIKVVPSTFEENLVEFSTAWEHAEANAIGKAQEVAGRLKSDKDWAVVIGADTVVVSDGKILGKPGKSDIAREMLNMLSGHTHQVYTGVAMVKRKDEGSMEMECFHELTHVTFPPLDKAVIESYVESGEPLDKAGGYGIQGLGGTLVEKVEGDYFNVVGLPLHRLCFKLIKFLSNNEE